MTPSNTELQAVADFLDPAEVGHLPDPDTCQHVGKWIRGVLLRDGAGNAQPPAYSACPFSREVLQDGDRIAQRLQGVENIPAAIVIARDGLMPVVHLHASTMHLPAGRYFLFRPCIGDADKREVSAPPMPRPAYLRDLCPYCEMREGGLHSAWCRHAGLRVSRLHCVGGTDGR